MTILQRSYAAGPALAALLALANASCGGAGPHESDDVNPVDGAPIDGAVDPSDRDGSVRADGSAAGDGGGGAGVPIPFVPGEVDPNAPADTGLPPLPRMINVRAVATGDSVNIAFDPIDGAADYRVYELPAKSDVSAEGDGHVAIRNALYRCAGHREAPPATMDGTEQVQSGAIKTLVDGQSIGGYTRNLADATLGYVFAEPGDNRVPVFALGDGRPNADNLCFFQRWSASRLKKYVTSTSERDQLIAQGFRDDGIAFYVPASVSIATRVISTSESSEGHRYYFAGDSAEAGMRSGASSAFNVLAEPADGAQPLMRVYYFNYCGLSHDELVGGMARFELARRQGDQQSLTRLHWSGLTEQTTLVVEALADGCPYQGMIAPQSSPGVPTETKYEPWVTIEQLRGSAPNGEVYINGQDDESSQPRPMARSFIRIGPAPAPDLDWSFGFKADDDFGAFTVDPNCGALDGNCFAQERAKANGVESEFIYAARKAQGAMLGEWWVAYADMAADTNGKYRLTSNTKGDITADSFLYVRMEVDAFTTLRRYPQILISDREAPIQPVLAQGHTLVVQTFLDWPSRYEIQVCDRRTWDVNDQCPFFELHAQKRDANDTGKITGLAPNVEIGDQFGLDHTNLFEVYVSTRRAYLYLDGAPFGCADLPSGAPSGAVTVTYGDVLYHSGVDGTYTFTKAHRQIDTIRHFDNLGFKSHVAAPAWDETRFPCVARLENW